MKSSRARGMLLTGLALLFVGLKRAGHQSSRFSSI